MSTNLTDNFLYKGKKPLDDRQLFKTKADMKAFPESALPTLYDAFCEEDGNKYVFNKANEINEETGKWRIFEGSSGSSADLSKYQKIEDDTLTTTDKTITGAINELKEEVGNNPVHYLGKGEYVGGSIDEVKKINNIGDLYLCNNAIDQIISGAMQDDKITFDYLPNATSNIVYISYEESIQILFNKEESSAGTYTVGYFIKYPKYGDTAFKSEEVNITPGEWVTFKNPDYTKCEYLVIKHDSPGIGGVVIESIKTRHYNQYSPHLYVFTEYGWMSTSNFEKSNYYSKTEVKELIDEATSTSNIDDVNSSADTTYSSNKIDTDFQKAEDNTLTTTEKNITGAINELNTEIGIQADEEQSTEATGMYKYIDDKVKEVVEVTNLNGLSIKYYTLFDDMAHDFYTKDNCLIIYDAAGDDASNLSEGTVEGEMFTSVETFTDNKFILCEGETVYYYDLTYIKSIYVKMNKKRK